MKKTIQSALVGMALALLLVAGIVIASSIASGSAKAQGQERKEVNKRAVLISARESYHYVTVVENGYTNQLYVPDGMVVEYTSASSNLLSLEYGVRLVDALTYYLAQNLHLQAQPVYGLFLLTD